MRYWRMAMREGSQGPDRFDDCRAKGIAAIDYWDEDGQRIVTDCRQLTPEEYERIWRTKAPGNVTGRVSLRRLWQEMKREDIIYAKTGKQVVGKGRISQGYDYDPTILQGTSGGELWGHFVTVRWEPDFTPFHCDFDAVQWTVLELTGDRLETVLAAERAARGKDARSLRRRISVPNDALPDDMSALEGEALKRVVVHRQRERRLRRAKIQQAMSLNGGRLRCEVPGCGFDFSEVYGELGREFAFVHHLQGLAARGKPSETRLEDLAVVCGNCHAMIHLGGECRSLEGLIPGHR